MGHLSIFCLFVCLSLLINNAVAFQTRGKISSLFRSREDTESSSGSAEQAAALEGLDANGKPEVIEEAKEAVATLNKPEAPPAPAPAPVDTKEIVNATDGFDAMSALLTLNNFQLAKSYAHNAPRDYRDAIIDSVMLCLPSSQRGKYVAELITAQAQLNPDLQLLLTNLFRSHAAKAWRYLVSASLPQSTLNQMLPGELQDALKNPNTFPFLALIPRGTCPKAGEGDVAAAQKQFLSILTKTIKQILITDLDGDLRTVLAEINKYYESRGATGPTPGDSPDADPNQKPEGEAPAAPVVDGSVDSGAASAFLAMSEDPSAVQKIDAEAQAIAAATKTEAESAATPQENTQPLAKGEVKKLEAKDSVMVMAEFVINRYIVTRLVPLLYAESKSSNEQYGVILVAESLRHLARLQPFKAEDASEGFMAFVNPWIEEYADDIAEWLVKQSAMKVEPAQEIIPNDLEKDDALVTLTHMGLEIQPDVLLGSTPESDPAPLARLGMLVTSLFTIFKEKYYIYPMVDLAKMSGRMKVFKTHLFNVLPHGIYYYGDDRYGKKNYPEVTKLFPHNGPIYQELLRGRFGFDKKVKLSYDVKNLGDVPGGIVATRKIMAYKKSFPTIDGSGMFCFTVQPLDGKLYVFCARESLAAKVYCAIAQNAGLLKSKDASDIFWMCVPEKIQLKYVSREQTEKAAEIDTEIAETKKPEEAAKNA